jgi:hypothetical protein
MQPPCRVRERARKLSELDTAGPAERIGTVDDMLTTDQKGNIAELAIARNAIELGTDVYRPVGEGGRYDMIFEIEDRRWRIQCKWAPRHKDVVVLRC